MPSCAIGLIWPLHGNEAAFRAAELDRRLTHLIDKLAPPPVKDNGQRQILLGMVAQLDQADAAANKILAADVGVDVDSMAESVSWLLSEIGTNVGRLLDHGARTSLK